MMSTSRTSISGVTFILGPVENEPPPAVENVIGNFSSQARACLSHWTPTRRWEFPDVAWL